MRLRRIAQAARRALADLVRGVRGRPARARGAGVYSGWIGPAGRVEEVPGTAVHVTLLARFGEATQDEFFAKGAVRYVDASDHVSLELMSQHPVALGNAIEALTRRWAHMADVDVEFLAPPGFLRASSAEARQALGRRLRAIEPRLEPERPMNSAATVRAFQQAIVALAQRKLGRPLTAQEHAFITAGRLPCPGGDPRHRDRRERGRAGGIPEFEMNGSPRGALRDRVLTAHPPGAAARPGRLVITPLGQGQFTFTVVRGTDKWAMRTRTDSPAAPAIWDHPAIRFDHERAKEDCLFGSPPAPPAGQQDHGPGARHTAAAGGERTRLAARVRPDERRA